MASMLVWCIMVNDQVCVRGGEGGRGVEGLHPEQIKLVSCVFDETT